MLWKQANENLEYVNNKCERRDKAMIEREIAIVCRTLFSSIIILFCEFIFINNFGVYRSRA